MARQVSEKTNVAYFNDPALVEEPGFYVVEKEAYENTVQPHTPDGKEIPDAAPVSLGVVLGKRVFVDDRADVPAEERQAGFFHEPFTADEGGES